VRVLDHDRFCISNHLKAQKIEYFEAISAS
jgi:hypothetical protein